MSWLRRLFRPTDAWAPADLTRRLRPLSFRIATESDFPICERLHEENEAHGVPSKHRPFYKEFLRESGALTLMVEDGSQIVATCGIQWLEERFAWLCYGLVSPSHHRTGIGTAMLLTRIGLLPTDQPDQKIGISAVESSLTFYRRFGFRLVGRFDWADGNRYPVAIMEGVHSRLIEDCRHHLAGAKITYPQLSIPYRMEPNQTVQRNAGSRPTSTIRPRPNPRPRPPRVAD